MEAGKHDTQTHKNMQHPKKTEVELGFREEEGKMPDREKRGAEQGRSVRRCPEIQDVVIRQLGDREREREKERARE